MCAVLTISLAFIGCGNGDRTDPQASRPDVSYSEGGPASTGIASTSVEERRAAFLNRIRSSDPQKDTIERAVINDKNELGLILSRQTNLDEVPRLMKAMLTQMAQDFPNQDLTVIAYTPTEPPRTIGTARLNASTRDMTYHPASAAE